MAWGRLALLQVAAESEAVRNTIADVFSYVKVAKTDDVIETSQQETTGIIIPLEEGEVAQITRPIRQDTYFLRVNKKQRLEQPKQQDQPPYLSHSSCCLAPSLGSYRFATATSLLSSAQLLPFLFNGLGTQRATHRIDHRHLIRQLETGKPLNQSPYLTQQRWPQQLMIIIDVSVHLEPYWVDFSQIVKQMKTLLGAEAVTAIRFYDESLEKKMPSCIAWPTTENSRYYAWQAPAVDVPILLLSDLGVTDPHQRMAVRWRRFFKPIQQQKTTIVTLSPVAQSPDNLLFCQQLKPTPLNDKQVLPRNAYCCGFRLDQEQILLQETMVEYALMFLSALPLMDSALLRRLRLALQWGGSELEGILWNHPKVSMTGLGIRLHQAEAEIYRKKYQQTIEKEQREHFWQIVHDHHQHAFTGLKQLEKLNECVLEQGDDEELEEYLKQFCASLMQTDKGTSKNKALLLQGKTLFASRPEAIWRSSVSELAHYLYALVYADDIQAERWSDTFEEGFQPEKVQWIIDKKKRQQQQSWLLIQQNDQAAFSCIKAENRSAFMTPIIEFTEIKGLPASLQQRHNKVIHSLKAGRLYQSSVTPAVWNIRSTTHQLEIEAIQKPTWAQRIWQDKDGLKVSVQWLGKRLVFPWRVADGTEPVVTTGEWQWQAPFGQDEYGVYIDFVIEGISQRFRWIEPSTFMMGSPEDEVGRWEGYETLHQVTLSQGYWLADTTVTQALWQAVMGDNPSYFNIEKTGLTSTDNHPVEQVSWDDCQRFMDSLKQKFPPLNVRFPTEAEWENACRAGTSSSFNFAGALDLIKVNYSGVFKKKDADDWHKNALKQTAPVKNYPCNAWGMYEMHGNVWEWCEDFWVDDLGNKPAIDPVAKKEGTKRVVRGGSWLHYGRLVRSAMRNLSSPDGSFNLIGLRLALGQPSYSQPNTASTVEQPRHQGGQARASAATVSTEAVAAELDKRTILGKLRDLFTYKDQG